MTTTSRDRTAPTYTVGQVARLADVTVRALHHYDETGVLSPSGRTSAGYRTYSRDDLERLHQVLLYRELGLPLEEVAALVNDPAVDTAAHLRRQHGLLRQRIERLQFMVEAVEKTLEAMDMGISLTPEERLELFGDMPHEEYDAEAEQRWGDTEAWQQSQRRTAAYTKDDWRAIKAEADDIQTGIAAAYGAGLPANSSQAMDAVERHRQHISRWFYDCPLSMHRCLGDMFVQDERFLATYERVAVGLAQYVREAISANADRLGA